MHDLLGLLPEEIATFLEPTGEPSYRAMQVFEWIHAKGVRDFEAMSNIPKGLRAWLSQRAFISVLEPSLLCRSADGSIKMVFTAADGAQFQAVLMPEEGRATLCVSCQVGCRMGCAFCLTGRMGLVRNLKASEIVAQVHAAARLLEGKSRITNVVFMGMGEPLDNLGEVVRAVRLITHRRGIAVARRRTTVSTVGLLPKLVEFLREGTGASVAVSLCATTDEARRKVVPIGKRYGIEDLVSTLRNNPLGHGHRYTIEYLLIDGVGDSLEDARRLSRILARFPAKVNLIPFNPWPGCAFLRPPEERIEAFYRYLKERNHIVTIRRSRGQDIGAACGQLGMEGVLVDGGRVRKGGPS